jgi:PleD family two-component response regulator
MKQVGRNFPHKKNKHHCNFHSMAKIMIVEENADLSIHIMQLLTKEQHDVIEVINTDNIFSKIYSFHPDIFVLGYNCREIEKQLKAFEPTHHLPVICLPEGPLVVTELLAAISESFQHRISHSFPQR